MKEVLVTGRSLPEAYHAALQALYHEGEEADCSDWGQNQKEVSMTMVVEEPLSEPMISRLFIGGPRELEQYRQEMLDGILDFEIAKGNWTYTYHDRMVRYPVGKDSFCDQIQFVIDELKRSPSSRRAVIIIRDVGVDAGSDDPACMQHIQYFIRNGKLECKLLFRSNDACKANFMNAYALIRLQEKIAKALGVEMGTYTHRANSFHCYEKDYAMLESYVKRLESGADNTYDFEDDWEDLMEEAKETVAKTVEELKNR